MKQTLKAHPLMIMRYLYRYIFILIVPLLHGLLSWGGKGALTNFLLAELFLVMLLAVYAVLSWRRCKIELSPDALTLYSGLFFRERARIRIKNCAGIFIEYKLSLAPFKGASVRLDTESGSTRKADFGIILWKKDAGTLLLHLHPERKVLKTYRSNQRGSLLMAVTSSSGITGLIIAVPVINNAAAVLGGNIAGRLADAVYDAAKLTELILRPVFGFFALLFILGFVVSFFVTFLRNANFFVFRMRGGLRIAAGALQKREVFFSESSLNMVRFEQRPLAKLFGRFSVKVCVAGYGKESKESAVLIPSDTGKACRDLVAGLLPSFKMEPLFLRIPRYAVWRTLIPYILLIGADIALAVAGTVLLPAFRRLIVIFAAGFFALLLLSLLVALRTWRVGGLTLGEQAEACAGTFFTSFRIKTGKHKVGVIRVMRTPFDIPENFCSVRVTVRSEKARSLTVPNLDYDETMAYIKKMYFD